MPDISIIITNWNTRQLLLDCIASIYSTVHIASFEIFVVDNGSSDGSVAAVGAQYPNVIIIANSRNEGFARANNMAIRRMTGTYAVLLNSDTLLKEAAIDRMFAFMEENPRVGICGPQLLYGDGLSQTSFGTFPEVWSELTSASLVNLLKTGKRRPPKPILYGPSKVDFIIGACMFVRKAAIEAAGMLDEDYFFFYEEIDWCYRLQKAGWHICHLPEIEIYHFGGESTKSINLKARVESWRSRYLFFKKNKQLAPLSWYSMILLGFFYSSQHLIVYTFMNLITLFTVKRLRRRWFMFAYLVAWHIRGLPVSMGIAR